MVVNLNQKGKCHNFALTTVHLFFKHDHFPDSKNI